MPEHYIYSNTDENRFWLQILGDYARLIFNALSPKLTAETQQAREFIKQFDDLLARARQYLAPEQLMELNKEAYAAAQNFRQYLLNILKMQSIQYVPISMQPALINHAVSFAEEYMYLLDAFINNKQPAFNAVESGLFWLPAGIVYARIIMDSSGMYQGQIKQKANEFVTRFKDLYLTALELHGVYRIGTTAFPIADQHNKDVIQALQDLSKFTKELIALVQQNRIPGTLSLLYIDGAERLICYYLTQLSIASRMEKPPCDPHRPRISEQ